MFGFIEKAKNFIKGILELKDKFVDSKDNIMSFIPHLLEFFKDKKFWFGVIVGLAIAVGGYFYVLTPLLNLF